MIARFCVVVPAFEAFDLPPKVHIQQVKTHKFLDAYEDSVENPVNDFRATVRPEQGDSTQIWIPEHIYEHRFESDYEVLFTLKQKSTGRFLDAYEGHSDYRATTRPRQYEKEWYTQMWKFTQVAEDPRGKIYTIQQYSKRRYLDAYEDSGHDYQVTTREAQYDDQAASQQWLVTPAMACTVSAHPSGNWVNTGRFSNADQTISLEYGTSRSYMSGTEETWGSSVTVAVEAGFEGFGSVSVSGTISQSISKSQSTTWTTQTMREDSWTWHEAGTIWQWQWAITDACGTATASANSFVLTNDANSVPCCLPGYFAHASDPRGACVQGSPREPRCQTAVKQQVNETHVSFPLV